MTAPRLAVDLGKIHHNARTLVDRLATRGISVTGVTKATLGSPEIAHAMLQAGVRGLGDSRVENLRAMRRAGVPGPLTLIRSPMLSQVTQVVQYADVSFNTELDVIEALSSTAGVMRRTHAVVLMVELGDLREGILPADLDRVVARTIRLPHIVLRGIGANLACQNGVTPDGRNMAELSALATSIESTFGVVLGQVSGGNSANLAWALGDDGIAGAGEAAVGRIDDLRLGESILLGRQPLDRSPIAGLHTDAITLVVEVIEAQVKPSRPWGDIAQTAFGEASSPPETGPRSQAILAIGHQDVDPYGLQPPTGMALLGASSDHLIVDAGGLGLAVGDEVRFGLNYSALVRAMTSPFVARSLVPGWSTTPFESIG